MAGPAFLRICQSGNSVSTLNPGNGMITRFARMAVETRGIFVTHRATMRVRAISHTVFLLVIARMVCRARRRIVAHQAIFCGLQAIMAFEAVGHAPPDVVAIEIFPGGNTGMAAATFRLSMFFMGKLIDIFEALTLAFGMPGLVEMAKATVSLFPALEMAFEAAFFTGSTEGIVYFRFLRKHITCTRCNYRSLPQWLPTRRQTRHRLCGTHLAINMACVATYRVFIVRVVRKT